MSVTINVGVIGLTVIKTRACAARLSVLEGRHYASYSLMQLNCGSSSVEGSSLSSSKGELVEVTGIRKKRNCTLIIR